MGQDLAIANFLVVGVLGQECVEPIEGAWRKAGAGNHSSEQVVQVSLISNPMHVPGPAAIQQAQSVPAFIWKADGQHNLLLMLITTLGIHSSWHLNH